MSGTSFLQYLPVCKPGVATWMTTPMLHQALPGDELSVPVDDERHEAEVPVAPAVGQTALAFCDYYASVPSDLNKCLGKCG